MFSLSKENEMAFIRCRGISDRDRVHALESVLLALGRAQQQFWQGSETPEWRRAQWARADDVCVHLAAAGYKLDASTGPNDALTALARIGINAETARQWITGLAARGYRIVATNEAEPIHITSTPFRKHYNALRRTYGKPEAIDPWIARREAERRRAGSAA
jgi:hypothetical protein